MADEGGWIIGVNWLSRSRITYRVTGGDIAAMQSLLGETVCVSGTIVDRGAWLNEIAVRSVQPSTTPGRLSVRVGYIKELGPSMYMQGTHILVDRDDKLICLLGTVEGGPDLNKYALSRAAVFGVLEKTVEGNAQIMRVQLVEPAK